MTRNRTTRPRIGIDLHTLEGLHQGSRTHCLELFSRIHGRMPQLDFVYFVDTTLWPAGTEAQFTGPNAKVVPMPASSSYYRLAFRLPALAAKHRIDLLHTQYICPPLVTAKTAVTTHDLLPVEYPEYFETFFRWRSKILFPLSAWKSEMVFTVSEYAKNQIRRFYHVAEDKVHILSNGVSFQRFYPGSDGADRVAAMGLEPGKYLLTVGRLEPRKNHLGLLRAYAAMATPRPKLAIVGQRDFGFEGIFELVKTLHLQDDVVFLEEVDDALVCALYRNAKVFVYPTFAEGFGMPILEAMASGVPVVASNTTSLPEVAGTAGIVVEPHSDQSIRQGIETVLHDDAVAARMSAAGLAQASEFTWERTTERLAAAYRQYFGIG